MVKKLDPRVRRTRQALRDAFHALILEKPYDDITVHDITERARLRRATFYLHYSDKHDLLLSILNEVFDDLLMTLHSQTDKPLTHQAEYATFLTIFSHVRQHVAIYRAVIDGPGASISLRYLRLHIVALARQKIRLQLPPEELPPIPLDMLANYMAAVQLQMLVWWLENGMPHPPETMARLCTQLALRGLSMDRLRSEGIGEELAGTL